MLNKPEPATRRYSISFSVLPSNLESGTGKHSSNAFVMFYQVSIIILHFKSLIMENPRKSPLEVSRKEFRKIGYQLIDAISDFMESIDKKKVTTGESPEEIQKIVGSLSLPEEGRSAQEILNAAAELLFNHSLLNGHPRFFGYVTASPAPIGALADLLASAVNPNLGANILSPAATEIEKQTIRWLAQFIGVSPDYGGLLVSGGNMANFTGFLTGRTVKAPASIKENGISNTTQKLVVYCSQTTHTWIEKAVILFGLGSRAIRWIGTDLNNVMDNAMLEHAIRDDLKNGFSPLMVIGTAGDVSTGAVDDLAGIALICKRYNLWFHVDGAYGLPACVIPEIKPLFRGIEEADSIALDPHKWLYNPLEAGCTLVKDANHLLQTFSFHPEYYNFGSNNNSVHNYYEFGLQNSRSFRALKVWLALQQVGRNGYVKMIGEDIQLSELMFEKVKAHPEIEAVTQHLSIATFRYVPLNYVSDTEDYNSYLNNLNEQLINELQHGGEVFLSHAIIRGKYCLRACIVNFRTSEQDIVAIIDIVVREGRKMHKKLQKELMSEEEKGM
jgi:glutamate/tyrosine decarboxylase-like PLP-dependent enzyme